MRHLYTAAFYIALPFILIRLYWRNFKVKSANPCAEQRLGFYPWKLKECIWLHAVSFGEAVAAEPLIKLIRQELPEWTLVVTTMTVTGASRVKASWQTDEKIKHLFVPYDIPFAIKRFFKAVNPKVGIIMETELWPNLLYLAGQRKLPLVLANARLSPPSFQGYKRAARFLLPYLQNLTHIAAQSKQDAERYLALGISKNTITMTGNLKFDIEPPMKQINEGKQVKQQLSHPLVITVASTHPQEEEQILDVFASLLQSHPKLLLVLVPRHPQRFDEVAQLCIKKGYKVARRSQQQLPMADTQIFLGDSMGEMYWYYALADIAFVGGSLVPIGGHNVLEAAALKIPIVTGPHMFNFTAISQWLKQAGALSIIASSQELYQQLSNLLASQEQREQKGLAGYGVLEENRGSAARHLEIINTVLA